MKSRLTRKEMLPLVGMTVSAFIFNTSEFMPIGLLTDIAKSFSISESKAGMLITVYSWIVMLLSLPLILLVSKIDFRNLFMGTIALLGNPNKNTEIQLANHSQILRKEINIHGVWNSYYASTPRNEWKYTVEMMDQEKFIRSTRSYFLF